MQGESLAQRLAQLPEDGETFLAPDAHIGRFPKIPRDVAEDQQRDGLAASIPRRPVQTNAS